jgi:hypothetical protein
MYRCAKTHDNVTGTLATMRKEQLQAEIDQQQDMDIGEDWEQEDCYNLAEVNLEDLESTLGVHQQYWLQGRQKDFGVSNIQVKVKQTHSGKLIYF